MKSSARCNHLSASAVELLCLMILCASAASASQVFSASIHQGSAEPFKTKNQSIGLDVVNRVEAAASGLVSRYGSNILLACPDAPVRLGTLRCEGCTWQTGRDNPAPSCSLENVVGYYQKAAVRPWVFGALVLAGVLNTAFVPGRSESHQTELLGRPRDVGLRLSPETRKELALFWSLFFCSNFCFAFIQSYSVICDSLFAAQAQDATVLTLAFGLLLVTMQRYFIPSGRVSNARFMFHNHSSKWILRLGIFVSVLLPLIAFSGWLLSRRFSLPGKVTMGLRSRFDENHYDLCFIDSYHRDAMATTVIAYLKGPLVLFSALLFLLGGHGVQWIFFRILNLAAVYTLFGAQLYYGRPVMRITGPMNIISEALAFDFVELAISHAFAWLGCLESIEFKMQMSENQSAN